MLRRLLAKSFRSVLFGKSNVSGLWNSRRSRFGRNCTCSGARKPDRFAVRDRFWLNYAFYALHSQADLYLLLDQVENEIEVLGDEGR